MSLFESLGQQTERIKQKITGDADYECLECGQALDEEHDFCPSCGSEAVVPKE